jgi:membrane protease subunit (stomatin/prohibitin family)
MNSTVTLSWLTVFSIFVIGLAVGWVMAKTRVSGSLQVEVSGVDPSQEGKPRTLSFVKTSTTRTLALKCQCGALWKFTESSGAQPLGTQPMPAGDSFICPKCGKSIDLKAERQLEAEALANLGFKNKA